MTMSKKIISVILCMFLLVQLKEMNTFAFDWPWANAKSQQSSTDQKNKCGKFENIDYAYDVCVKDLKKNRRFCKQLRIGSQCTTDLWFWDYIEIKTAIKSLEDWVKKTKEKISINEIVMKVADTFKVLFKSDSDIAKEVSRLWINQTNLMNFDSGAELDAQASAIKTAGNIQVKSRIASVVSGIAGLIGGGTAVNFMPGLGKYKLPIQAISYIVGILVGGAGGAAIGHFTIAEIMAIADETERAEALKKYYIYVNSYALAFENILEGVIKKNWRHGDMLSLKVNYDPEEQYAEAHFLTQGIEYDSKAKSEFEETFNRLETDLGTIVNSTKAQQGGSDN